VGGAVEGERRKDIDGIEEVLTDNTFAAKVERRLAEMQNAGL
jgi:hypothetical protein